MYFSKYVYFSVDITERNSTVFTKVITAKHAGAKSCKEMILISFPFCGLTKKPAVITSWYYRLYRKLKRIFKILW
jgi:hypothetical protein